MAGTGTQRLLTHRREISALAALITVLALVLGRGLDRISRDFDEGVYLASARALAEGARLGGELFASQPPLFFELLETAHRLAGGDGTLLRAVMVGSVVLGAVAGWAVVRPIAGPAAGLAAAAAFVAAPAVPTSAGVVSATLPSLALAVAAVAAGQRWRRHPAWAVAAGALFAAAVLVKLLALPAGAALLAIAARDRVPPTRIAAAGAGAAAVAAATLLTARPDLGAVWEGAVGIRSAARSVDLGASPPDPALLAGWGALLLLLGLAAAQGVAGRREWAVRRMPLLAWSAVAVATLALHRPLFVHHLAAASAPLALLGVSAVPRRPDRPAAGVLCAAVVLALPGLVAARPTVTDPERDRLETIARIVRDATPPAAAVTSDLPLVPILAGRASPPETIDASFVRVGSGGLDLATVLRAADRSGAVVTGRAFLRMPGLEPELRRRFPVRIRMGAVLVYLRGRPSGPMR